MPAAPQVVSSSTSSSISVREAFIAAAVTRAEEAATAAAESAKKAEASSQAAAAAAAAEPSAQSEADTAAAAATEAAAAAQEAKQAEQAAATAASRGALQKTTDAAEAAKKAAAAAADAEQKAAEAAKKAAAVSPAATAAAALSSPSSASAAAVSSPSSSAAQSDVYYFMESWGNNTSIIKWYAGDNILDDAKKIKKIIEYQQIFRIVNLGNLRIRPVNGAILSIDGTNKLSYFDYNYFKITVEQNGQNGGGSLLNKFGFVDEKEAKKRSELNQFLGLGINLIPKKVVSLLSDGDRLIGMCYSECGSSDIDREFFGKIETNRLICIKKGDIENVKILFFTGHSLGYVFFNGTVKFDDNGNFIGLVEGSLLRKVKDYENVYQVLKGTFQGTTVTPGNTNEFLQYGYTAYTASTLSATGYAAGYVEWNLQNPFPLANMTKPGITFLNWNFGPVTVEKRKVTSGDHGGSECTSMYYTSYSFDFNSIHNPQRLITDASSPNTSLPGKPKIEFIKKEGYTDFFHNAKVTLLQLKFKVAKGVFCIIELAKYEGKPVHRVRIYKTYDDAISVNIEQPARKVKKHGLFIGLDPSNASAIEFVSFYEVDERGDTTGVNYETKLVTENNTSSKRKKIATILSTYNQEFMSKKINKNIDKKGYGPVKNCRELDEFTKESFKSSLSAAVVSFELFLNTDGLVGILENYLKPAAAAAPTPQDSIKKSLLDEVTAMKTTLDSELRKAMEYVESAEMAESYVGSVKKSSFRDFFNKSPTTALPPPGSPSGSPSGSPISITLTKYIDDDTTFKLVDEPSINQILNQSPGSYMYNSDNTSIATIDNITGDVTLITRGTATITIKDSRSDAIATINLTVEQSRPQSPAPAPAPAPPLTLEEGCIATYNGEKVFVEEKYNNNQHKVRKNDRKLYVVFDTSLTPFMSAADVTASKEKGIRTYDMISRPKVGCIAFMKRQGEYVYVVSIDSINNNAEVLITDGNKSTVKADSLISVMSAPDVREETNKGVLIMDILKKFSSAAAAAAAPAPVLEEGGIAKYNDEKVFVLAIDNAGYINIKNKDKREFPVRNTALTPFMSKAEVDNSGQRIDQLLAGGKGRRRSTRKYQKRRGRGNGNNGRRRLTRKVKGQSGGGGGGGGARRGGKIHRKTKKNVRRGRGGRRGHRRTIKKYHRR